MKFIKNVIILGCFLLINACVGGKKEVIDLGGKKRISKEDLNIIITPDLSNRVKIKLYPKPVSDIKLIKNVFNNYYPALYEYNKRINGQKDVINLAFTNSNIINEYDYKGGFLIDINKKEEENNLYLKTFDGSETQFETESKLFVNELNKIYEKANVLPAGADIFSFFQNKLTTIVKKDILNLQVQNFIIDNKFRNILVLFTDGYLEAGLYGESNCIDNKCYFLDGTIIRNFRNDYKINSKGLDIKSFFEEKGYGIIPVKNDRLKDVEVFVCELYDRSLNRRTGSQTVVPNDLDIIKLFWTDWLIKSGVKRFKLLEKVNFS